MAKKKESTTKQTKTMRQALTPEAEENQCIHLAMQRAKEQLLDGTASSQVIVHFLKLGSSKEKIEKDILEHQRDLISAKTDQIRSTKQPGDLYGEAQEALQGLRCRIATVDEWLSADVRENPIEAIEQGASKNDDYLIIATSSEGTVRNGSGDTVKMDLMKILKGEAKEQSTSIWWYKLDSIDEVGKPEMWLKANPNIGKTVTYEVYQKAVEKAENSPSTRNDILAKRFGIPMEGQTYFFTYEETLLHKRRNYWQMPCALGADLSQGDDFCAFTFLFPLGGGRFGVKTRNYISEITLKKLPPAMRVKYESFIEENSLMVMPGTVLNMIDVYDDLDSFIADNAYDVRCFGYDPYNAKEFVERWATENGSFGVEKIIQGARTESVPLGELKKLAEERILYFDEELMKFAMGNCIIIEDTNGNRKLSKKRYDQKIDAVAAMMDAYVAYKLNIDAFE